MVKGYALKLTTMGMFNQMHYLALVRDLSWDTSMCIAIKNVSTNVQ